MLFGISPTPLTLSSPYPKPGHLLQQHTSAQPLLPYGSVLLDGVSTGQPISLSNLKSPLLCDQTIFTFRDVSGEAGEGEAGEYAAVAPDEEHADAGAQACSAAQRVQRVDDDVVAVESDGRQSHDGHGAGQSAEEAVDLTACNSQRLRSVNAVAINAQVIY